MENGNGGGVDETLKSGGQANEGIQELNGKMKLSTIATCTKKEKMEQSTRRKRTQ